MSSSTGASQTAGAGRLKVLLWGTYDTSKPRIRILIEGLNRCGIDVSQIHADIWSRIEDKSQIRGASSKLFLLVRWFTAYPSLAWRLARARRPDVILISYPGLLDAFVAGLMGRIRRIPVAWDIFLSVYDTVVLDRQLVGKNTWRATALRKLEQLAMRSVQILFMDTRAHARRIEAMFGLPKDSIGAVWVGAESALFAPPQREATSNSSTEMRVMFYGQYIPLHGLPTIIQAARMLRDEPINWVLVGRGQESVRIHQMLTEVPLPRVRCIDWVNYSELRNHILKADLTLGIFGDSEKAASVIPNKVFQIAAVGRPLITRDSPAIRELFATPSSCVQFVPPADAKALAEKIVGYFRAGDWRRPRRCHGALQQAISEQAVGTQLVMLLRERLSHVQSDQ
jgi:glycosyltransferase involved in cell wall biosynthesis